jgi:hypothetical protein
VSVWSFADAIKSLLVSHDGNRVSAVIWVCISSSSSSEIASGWYKLHFPHGFRGIPGENPVGEHESMLKSKGISKNFDEWIAIAKDRPKRSQ